MIVTSRGLVARWRLCDRDGDAHMGWLNDPDSDAAERARPRDDGRAVRIGVPHA